jgi:hypothetical protein
VCGSGRRGHVLVRHAHEQQQRFPTRLAPPDSSWPRLHLPKDGPVRHATCVRLAFPVRQVASQGLYSALAAFPAAQASRASLSWGSSGFEWGCSHGSDRERVPIAIHSPVQSIP